MCATRSAGVPEVVRGKFWLDAYIPIKKKCQNEVYCHNLHESTSLLGLTLHQQFQFKSTVKLTFNQITVLSFQVSTVE